MSRLLSGSSLCALLVGALAACSSAPKTTPELSRLEGRKVALVEVTGEATARAVFEVALVNQIREHGSFILVSKQDTERARQAPGTQISDWRGWAQAAGADLALRIEVRRFEAETHEGVSSETVTDSQLAAERGDDGKSERLVRVKSLDGAVSANLEFTDLKTGEVRRALAEKQDRKVAEERTSAMHLPPRLRFLEKLAQDALAEFFERYQ